MRPAEHLLPRRVQQREATVERDRRQQVAGHLEQPRDPRLARRASGRRRRWPVRARAGRSPRGWCSVGGTHALAHHVGARPPSPVASRAGRMPRRYRGAHRHGRSCRVSGPGRRLRSARRRAARPARARPACASARRVESPRRKRQIDRHMIIVMSTALDDAPLADFVEREQLAVGQVGAEAEAAERQRRRREPGPLAFRSQQRAEDRRCSRSGRSARRERRRARSSAISAPGCRGCP